MAFTVGTQNMRHGHAQPRNFAVLVNRQEMDSEAAHKRLRMKRRYWHTPHAGLDVSPRDHLTISGRKRRSKLLHSGWVKVHGGILGKTPTRGVGYAVVKVGKRTLILINAWPINGGFKPEKFGRVEANWREALHDAYVEAMRRLIRDLRTGHPDAEVVVAGDMNWPRAIDLPGLRIVARNGVDHIYASKGLRKRRAWRLPRWGSDHRPLKARLSWRKK